MTTPHILRLVQSADAISSMPGGKRSFAADPAPDGRGEHGAVSPVEWMNTLEEGQYDALLASD